MLNRTIFTSAILTLALGFSSCQSSPEKTEPPSSPQSQNQASIQDTIPPKRQSLNIKKFREQPLKAVFNGKKWEPLAGHCNSFLMVDQKEHYQIKIYPKEWKDCLVNPDPQMMENEAYLQLTIPTAGVVHDFVVSNIQYAGRFHHALNVWNDDCTVFIEESTPDSLLVYVRYSEGTLMDIDGYFPVSFCP